MFRALNRMARALPSIAKKIRIRNTTNGPLKGLKKYAINIFINEVGSLAKLKCLIKELKTIKEKNKTDIKETKISFESPQRPIRKPSWQGLSIIYFEARIDKSKTNKIKNK